MLRIGTLFPTSGTFSFIGAAQVAGVALAVKELNDAGGVNGAPVELIQKDSGEATGGTAETSMAELVTAGVDVVIGPSSSVLVERLLPVVTESGIPMISPAATLPSLTGLEDDGMVFRTIPSYELQGYALADALAGTKVALLVLDDEMGDLLAETLMMGLDGNGGDLTVIPFPASTTDWAALAQQVVDAAPDSVVLATPGNAADQNKAVDPGAGLGGLRRRQALAHDPERRRLLAGDRRRDAQRRQRRAGGLRRGRRLEQPSEDGGQRSRRIPVRRRGLRRHDAGRTGRDDGR